MNRTLLGLLLVAVLATNASAVYVQWDGQAGDSDWSNPLNWDEQTTHANRVPNATADKAGFKGGTSASYPRFDMVTSPVYQLVIGGPSGFLTLDGGSVTVNQYFGMSAATGENSTFNMNGGTFTTGASGTNGNFLVGNTNAGTCIATVNMVNGTINAAKDYAGMRFSIADTAGSTGTVNLDGGAIYARDFFMNKNGGGTALLNITAGKLYVNKDNGEQARIQGYLDAGTLIKGYGSAANIVMDTTSDLTYIIVSAVPEPATICLLGLGLLGLLGRKRK